MTRLTFAAFVLALSIVACGGDDNTPTNPGPPPLPNYTGIWSGNYTITACTQNGTIALANICSTLGNTAPFNLNIGQNATTNGVQGTFNLGTVPFTIVPSTVASNGSLTFAGTSLNNGITVLATWTLTSPIVGNLSQVWSSNLLTGQANLTGSINIGVAKTGSVSARPSAPAQSIPELLRALQNQPL